MPRPENQYFLDSAYELTHIANDVHFFFTHVHQATDDHIDGYRSRRPAMTGYSKHWNCLQAMGLHCEAEYLAWRVNNRTLAKGASWNGYERLSGQVEHLVENYAHCLVDAGFERLTPLAMLRAEQHYGFRNDLGVLKRAAVRAYHDLDGYRHDALVAANEISTAMSAQYRVEVDRAWDELRRYIETQDRPREPDLTATRGQMAIERRRQRSVINRSKTFVRRLLGKNTTRLLLRGNTIQVQGELAAYEIRLRQHKRLIGGHGQTDFSVFTPDGVIELCRLCIYTDDVPVLDHVASLIMHIQAGEEEKILAIGNAYQIHEQAYEALWLVPFLPKRRTVLPVRIPSPHFGHRHVHYHRVERQHRIRAMSGLLLDHVKQDIGRWLPPMQTAEHLIRTGERVPGSREETHAVEFEMPEEEADDAVAVALARANHHFALRQIMTTPGAMIEMAAGLPRREPTEAIGLIATD